MFVKVVFMHVHSSIKKFKRLPACKLLEFDDVSNCVRISLQISLQISLTVLTVTGNPMVATVPVLIEFLVTPVCFYNVREVVYIAQTFYPSTEVKTS